jgi:hypothetical protein
MTKNSLLADNSLERRKNQGHKTEGKFIALVRRTWKTTTVVKEHFTGWMSKEFLGKIILLPKSNGSNIKLCNMK